MIAMGLVFGIFLIVLLYYLFVVAFSFVDMTFTVIAMLIIIFVLYKLCVGFGAFWALLKTSFVLLARILFIGIVVFVIYTIYKAIREDKELLVYTYYDIKGIFEKGFRKLSLLFKEANKSHLFRFLFQNESSGRGYEESDKEENMKVMYKKD